MADLSKIKLNGTEYDLKDAVARAAIGNALQVEVVEELPTEDIDENILYLIPREQIVAHTETKTVTSATTTASTFSTLATNLNSTYSINIIVSQTLNDTTTQLLNYSNDNISFNIPEVTTLYDQDDWQIQITLATSIKVQFTGELANWTKDSWSVALTLIENLPSNNIYDEYLYVDNSWENLGENTSNFMIKGFDYVTAGQAAGTTLGRRATAEGQNTTASGTYAHAEGSRTSATGTASHSEGATTIASGNYSHAEGSNTKASGGYSHAEGSLTSAEGGYAHAEGAQTQATGQRAHVEGFGVFNNVIKVTGAANVKTYSFTYTNNNAQAIVVGQSVRATIGGSSITTSITAIDKTNNTVTFADTLDSANAVSALNVSIYGKASGAESHAEGYATTASNEGSHAEGGATVASGIWGHAEGYATLASRGQSHAEGTLTVASATNAHAEGYKSMASGTSSHAEGGSTTASGDGAHAEGVSTIASGYGSHAEGHTTVSSGLQSHSEGWSTTASGNTAHTEGQFTIASNQSQHVFGEANIEDTTGSADARGLYVEIVGNGTIDTSSSTPVITRSNARTLDWNGNELLSGKLTVGSGPVNDMDVTTKLYVDTAVSGVAVPTAETNANVASMLTGYGLNAAANLSAATVGNSSTGSAVVQPNPPAQN